MIGHRANGRLDREASRTGKLTGMDLVSAGREDDIARGVEIIRWLAPRFPYITCDDTWACGYEVGGADARILGPVFRAAAEAGLVYLIGTTVKTIQKARHRSPVQVWASIPFGEAPPFVEALLYSRILEHRQRQRAGDLWATRHHPGQQRKRRSRSLRTLRLERCRAALRERRSHALKRRLAWIARAALAAQ